MSLQQKQVLRQGASVTMTPQLARAIAMLHMPLADLTAFIENEVQTNPLLELADRSDEGNAASTAEPESAAGDLVDLAQDRITDADTALDADAEDVYPEHQEDGAGPSSPSFHPEGVSGSGYDDEIGVHETVSLAAHLSRQFNMAESDPVRCLLAQQMIDTIDETGYVTQPLDGFAARLNVPLALVEDVLLQLQSCEPAGIAARTLRECLALQLKDKNRLDPAMETMLDRLDLVAKGDFVTLRRLCGVDAEDVVEMIHEIRRLDPKPGLHFSAHIASTLVPDVFVRAAGPGEWVVDINADALPKVLVQERYAARLTTAARGAAEKHYISSCLTKANWLVKSLDQRARTLLQVTTELVRQQAAFFDDGASALKPLSLRAVAAAVGVHESTVSRATAHKYLSCARGVFELRYFFSAGVNGAAGEGSVAAQKVRHLIGTLIANEKPESILSDEDLVRLLKEQGIDVARRTVAKYRDLLGIPTSAHRKRHKRVRAS